MKIHKSQLESKEFTPITHGGFWKRWEDNAAIKKIIKSYIKFCGQQDPEIMWIKDIPEGISYEEFALQKQEEFIDNFINYFNFESVFIDDGETTNKMRRK